MHFSLFLAENILFVFDYIPTLSINEDYLLLVYSLLENPGLVEHGEQKGLPN